MHAAGRLGLYAIGLVIAFVGAYGISAAVVPAGVVADGAEAARDGGAAMSGHAAMTDGSQDASLPGVSMSADGYALSAVASPASTDEPGELAFRILTTGGEPLTDFAVSHEKRLHLIVVRGDGALFRHVHPTLDTTTGTWSLPWQWDEAGTYRVYADFTPGDGTAEGVVLTRTVHIAGELAPVRAEPTRSAIVDDFALSITGDLTAGTASELTVSISRGNEPVTELEPYLGAFGHLVALRDGDLAYLHVHPQGEDPQPGGTSGPDVSFMVEAPTTGRYLLYFDFQVDGQVRTAAFVVDAESGQRSTPTGHGDEAPHGH